MDQQELKQWVDSLSNEDKEWIFKKYGAYDYERAYLEGGI